MTKEISRVEFFCEDQLVGKIQRMLMQIRGAYDFKAVPVINAEIKPNGGLGAVTGGTMYEQFAASLTGSKETTAREIKDWLESIGRSRSSGGYLIKYGMRSGILAAKKGKGQRGHYVVKKS